MQTSDFWNLDWHGEWGQVTTVIAPGVTTAVGLITEPAQAEAILAAGDADLIALDRVMLYKSRWPWEAVAALGL